MSCKEIGVNIIIGIGTGLISGGITGLVTGNIIGKRFEERGRKLKFKHERQQIVRNIGKIMDMLEDVGGGTMEPQEFKQHFDSYRINPEIFKSKNIEGKKKKKAFKEYSLLLNQIYTKNGNFQKEEIGEFNKRLLQVSKKLSQAKYKKSKFKIKIGYER